MEVEDRQLRPASRPHCYICGSTENLTNDHIPPKGFFPTLQRKDLLTSPLCGSCHPRLAKMDEKMRLWLAAAAGASSSAKWIWRNKVVGSTFKRNPKLVTYIRKKHFRPIINKGVLLGGVLTIPQGCAIPFFRRLTKGILYALHPDYDYFPDFFTVDYHPETADSVAAIAELVSRLPQLARGNGVFRVWHGTADTGDAGVCVYLFFDAVCFVCFHGKAMTFDQQFDKDYSEERDLPKHL
jgi:hypothetical protein